MRGMISKKIRTRKQSLRSIKRRRKRKKRLRLLKSSCISLLLSLIRNIERKLKKPIKLHFIMIKGLERTSVINFASNSSKVTLTTTLYRVAL